MCVHRDVVGGLYLETMPKSFFEEVLPCDIPNHLRNVACKVMHQVGALANAVGSYGEHLVVEVKRAFKASIT